MQFNFKAAMLKIDTLSHNEWIKEFKLARCENGYYVIRIITDEGVWLEVM